MAERIGEKEIAAFCSEVLGAGPNVKDHRSRELRWTAFRLPGPVRASPGGAPNRSETLKGGKKPTEGHSFPDVEDFVKK